MSRIAATARVVSTWSAAGGGVCGGRRISLAAGTVLALLFAGCGADKLSSDAGAAPDRNG